MKLKILLLAVFIIGITSYLYRITNKVDVNQITPDESESVVTRRVMVLNYDPIVPETGEPLHVYKKWNDPHVLTEQYISDIKKISHNYLGYVIDTWLDIDDIPVKQDGFEYTISTYLSCLLDNTNCYKPDLVNYSEILSINEVCEMANQAQIDELWVFGGPYFGYYEANMAGPSAIHTNGPPVTNTSCIRNIHVMGFNYERDVSKMIEDLGHRTEGILANIFQEDPRHNLNLKSNWSEFVYACGWMHYTPNSINDYDWGNLTLVYSACEDWLKYPNLTGFQVQVNGDTWVDQSTGDYGYGYMKWWFSHLPHVAGKTDGKFNNWWKYVIDHTKPGSFPDNIPTPTPSPSPQPSIDPNALVYSIRSGSRDYNVSCGTEKGNKEIYLGFNTTACSLTKYKAVLTFNIPKISKLTSISSAFLIVTTDGPYNQVLKERLTLKSGRLSANPVVWTISEPWVWGKSASTPDLSQAIKQLVSQRGYDSTNPLVIEITHVSGDKHRRFYAFERDASKSAKLIINVQSSSPTPSPSPSGNPAEVPGDVDRDGDVDIFDYTALLINYGKTGENVPGDFNHDGVVNLFDYTTLLVNFGKH